MLQLQSKKKVPFFRMVVDELKRNRSITLNLCDIPLSYREQPYNLSAKLSERAQLKTKVSLTKTKIVIYVTSPIGLPTT